jgi:hypothetical protein
MQGRRLRAIRNYCSPDYPADPDMNAALLDVAFAKGSGIERD